ncbi:MAG: protein translocase subunit SecD [Planctomycetes bacterium]|nr:protein translocase subunit SecD [Planctomycetota bacterium]
MLENARRQVLLVALAIAASLLVLALTPLNYGLDLSGGVQLVYEVDIQDSKDKGIIPKNATEAEVSAVLDSTVQIILERIDPQGTREAVVTRRGEHGILIELPRLSEADALTVESQIQDLGRLEFRMLASEQYAKGGVSFNVREERRRLQEWLDANDGANRKLVAADPEAIDIFNKLGVDVGGPQAGENLKWRAKLVEPNLDNLSHWAAAESFGPAGPITEGSAVAAFTAQEWNGGIVPDDAKKGGGGKPFLVEYLPINWHEQKFDGQDLDPSYTRAGLGRNGRAAIHYQMRVDRQTAYADWSEEYKGQRSAIILNNIVYSAPTFLGQILGAAEISSDTFTQREVDALVRTLRTGSLQVKPIRQSRDNIGATLGQRSIYLAGLSIALGGILLLAFVMWYYRLAGFIACAALAVNVLLIMGIVVFLRATLTLPGLAGLVLTMGMAVDSNILIYERIREELERGKEMLQACRAGFERALGTILDANLTTFIAGIVLYQLGTGPVRGFAVTLMVGIVTTIFTAYYVTRLMFHFMLERDALGSLRFSAWLKNANFDFMRARKLWFGISIVVIGIGLTAFATIPNDDKYGIDFTGGANLKVVLREQKTADEVRDLLGEYAKRFDGVIVNTVGDVIDGKATRFSIRVKLSDTQRTAIDAERRAAGSDYQPPYLTALHEALGQNLVPEAFSGVRVDPNPARTLDFGEIQLHFVQDVSIAALKAKLAVLGGDIQTTNLDDEKAEVGRNFKVEFDVVKETPPTALFEMVQNRIAGLRTAAGQPVELSNPIPESSEIGGRLVGELRSAAINALAVSLLAIVLYIRIRFHEYKFGIAGVVALVHDVLVTLGFVVVFNWLGWVDAEIDLTMIAAFLTIIGYSINDTIVIFDRVRENLSDAKRLGEKIDRAALLNRSVNQTLSRTILTTATVMLVVIAQFAVNFQAGTTLEGFSFALLVGMISGTYSTVFIASPIVLWLWDREREQAEAQAQVATGQITAAPATPGSAVPSGEAGS